jgi:hypothetical protein
VFIEAALVFRQLRNRLIHTVRLIGTLIWSEGLLLKGNGLCHGICGNGYLLHSISRFFTQLSVHSDAATPSMTMLKELGEVSSVGEFSSDGEDAVTLLEHMHEGMQWASKAWYFA